MLDSKKLKPMPHLMSDEEAEDFVANADLTEYDLSVFKPVKFEFTNKDKSLNMRLPSALLDAVKAAAQKQKMPYQRYIRQILENAVSRGG